MDNFDIKKLFQYIKNSQFGPLVYFLISLSATVYLSTLIKDSFKDGSEFEDSQSLLVAFALISSSFMVSFSIAFVERLGISGNLQEHISKEIDDIKNKIEEIIKSRLSYGLTAAKKGDSVERDIIEKLDDGDKIYWMDTVLHDFETTISTIIEKVTEKDIEVKILLMSPENDCSSYRREMTSNYSHENYVADLRSGESKIASRLFDLAELRKLKDSKIKGNIEILYYKDMISFPLFIFERSKTKYEEAYTGFYLNKLSSKSPYLKWESSSNEPFYVDLWDYFDLRWKREDNHLPRSDDDNAEIEGPPEIESASDTKKTTNG